MLINKTIKGLLGVATAAVLCGAFSASAQTPAVGAAVNEQTPAGAAIEPPGSRETHNKNPGVVPPLVGEANDHTSPNADMRPAPKAKPVKRKVRKHHVKAPVTGEANDHTSNGGTTEAAKAVKAAKASTM